MPRQTRPHGHVRRDQRPERDGGHPAVLRSATHGARQLHGGPGGVASRVETGRSRQAKTSDRSSAPVERGCRGAASHGVAQFLRQGRLEDLMRILDVINKTTPFFEKAGIDSPRLSIELLLAHLLKKKRLDLYMEFERELDESTLAALREMVKRRVAGEPLQYIAGEAEFCG